MERLQTKLNRLVHYAPTGNVFQEMLTDLTPPGSPVYNIPDPAELGYPERKDTDGNLTPSQMNEAIYFEGLRMAGEEVVDIGNNRELIVFNTTAASTHTVLTANYQEWEWAFRRQAQRQGIDVPEGTLVQGRGHTVDDPKVPSLVPLDMVTWVMVRDKNNWTYMPCDVNDLTSLPTGNIHIDQHKLQLDDDKIRQLYAAISKRNRLAIYTMLDLHNNVLRKEMPFLREKTEEDLLIGCLSGYYRGDEAKQLGQFEHDHRGKGPMSNPTLHFRITDHFTMEDANILDQRNPSISFNKMIDILHDRYPSYFSGSISFAAIKPEALIDDSESKVLQQFMKDKRFSLYDLIKTIDPYASIAHEHLAGWLQEELDEIFYDIPHRKELFAHHTSDYERELRVSEGARIQIEIPAAEDAKRGEVMSECFARISGWIGQRLYPMWEDINNLIQRKPTMSAVDFAGELETVKEIYNLPDHFKQVISLLEPTERQLKLLREETESNGENPLREAHLHRIDKKLASYWRRKKRNSEAIVEAKAMLAEGNGTFEDFIGLLTLIQSSQLYDNEGLPPGSPKLNDGYNIPGVPGTAITYHFDKEGKLNINIGWLLSTKGMSELWLGSIMKRKERRDR